jgi:hypothetical protein
MQCEECGREQSGGKFYQCKPCAKFGLHHYYCGSHCQHEHWNKPDGHKNFCAKTISKWWFKKLGGNLSDAQRVANDGKLSHEEEVAAVEAGFNVERVVGLLARFAVKAEIVTELQQVNEKRFRDFNLYHFGTAGAKMTAEDVATKIITEGLAKYDLD